MVVIEQVIEDVLRSRLSRDLADQLQGEIVQAIQLRCGGETVYILKKPKLDRAALTAQFTGRNIDELCRDFQITRQRVYQILNEN